jgi:hypothetical protein
MVPSKPWISAFAGMTVVISGDKQYDHNRHVHPLLSMPQRYALFLPL